MTRTCIYVGRKRSARLGLLGRLLLHLNVVCCCLLVRAWCKVSIRGSLGVSIQHRLIIGCDGDLSASCYTSIGRGCLRASLHKSHSQGGLRVPALRQQAKRTCVPPSPCSRP